MLRRISVITSEDDCFAEIMRRDTRNLEVVFKKRSELQRHQAELRHILGRSKQKAYIWRNGCEETRTENARIAPKFTRLQAREAQLSTRVSIKRNQETELHGPLQDLQQENARIKACMNQIQITKNSMDSRNKGLTLQLQTSNLGLRRSHNLRQSAEIEPLILSSQEAEGRRRALSSMGRRAQN